MWTAFRRRFASRALAALAAIAVGSAVSLTAAAPALAACATAGHIYYVPNNNLYLRWETDPVDSPTYDFFFGPFPSGSVVHIRLGGNGLKPATVVRWTVYNQNGANIKTLPLLVRGNCVANETSFEIPAEPGTILTLKADYDAGNTGRQVRQQNHLKFTFFQFG